MPNGGYIRKYKEDRPVVEFVMILIRRYRLMICRPRDLFSRLGIVFPILAGIQWSGRV